jgi:hypothetical protein
VPSEDFILRPPTRRNSYGRLRGGVTSKTSRASASERSRDPPAVARSLPAASIVTPKSRHFATQWRFHGSFARPPNGATRPEAPHPVAHATSSGSHRYATVSPSQSLAAVVPIRPHVSHTTITGSHPSGWRTFATSR